MEQFGGITYSEYLYYVPRVYQKIDKNYEILGYNFVIIQNPPVYKKIRQ